MNDLDAIASLGNRIAVLAPGHVWLAGAGPGDPGLLTLYAICGLAQADVIVHDALVDKRVLALAGAQAKLEFAGKRGGRPSATQADISRRLVELAKAGHRVLRLKGGDPCVFGRGGEEAMALAAAGVPFRFIPGVTAGLAALAAASIPPRCARSTAQSSSPRVTAPTMTASIGGRLRARASRSCSTW